jgi:hypothetical protein
MAVGFTFNYFFSTVWNVAMPYLYNTDQAHLGGKIGWIFSFLGLVTLVIIYFEVPEIWMRCSMRTSVLGHSGHIGAVHLRKLGSWAKSKFMSIWAAVSGTWGLTI